MYVAYSAISGFTGGDLVVERFQVSPGDPNQLQTPGIEVLRVPHQDSARHYAGRLAFGPDGMLYVSIGDGSDAVDSLRTGQDPTTLLGKLLRLDVSALPYTVPANNPTWGGVPGARRENWAIGLRNPWRYSFDPPSGLLYIADVGQAQREEINIVPATSAGLNYGWSTMEGSRCFSAPTCSTAGLTLPIVEYDHTAGCAVSGGYVYRGDAIPALRGRYLYSDFCRGYLASLRYEGGVLVERVQWLPGGSGSPQSFGIDGAGEIYMLMQDGRVLRVTQLTRANALDERVAPSCASTVARSRLRCLERGSTGAVCRERRLLLADRAFAPRSPRRIHARPVSSRRPDRPADRLRRGRGQRRAAGSRSDTHASSRASAGAVTAPSPTAPSA